MSPEQSAAEQKRAPAAPAEKTDAPRGVRGDSIKNIQSDDFFCVEPSTPLAEAIELIKNGEGGCAFVCENGHVVGIFTEHEVTVIIGKGVDISAGAPVGDWMSREVEALAPEATLGDAVRVMNERGHHNIPVVEGERIVGAISVFDLITYLTESCPKETMNLPPVPAQVMDTQEGG